MPRGKPVHAGAALHPAIVSRKPSRPPKAHRAGFAPWCEVLRTGLRSNPAFVGVWRGQQSQQNFPTAEAARAWLATCDVLRRYQRAP